MVTVCTVLPPIERPRLDAAGDGCFLTLHATSFRDAMRAARRRRVDALVLSVHACRGEELPAVARFVREFPAIPGCARPWTAPSRRAGGACVTWSATRRRPWPSGSSPAWCRASARRPETYAP